MIKSTNPLRIKCEPDDLDLFLAKTENGQWLLEAEDPATQELEKGATHPDVQKMINDNKMPPSWEIREVLDKFEMTGEKAPSSKQIHVLVKLPGDIVDAASIGSNVVGGKRERTDAVGPRQLNELLAVAQQLKSAKVGTLLHTPAKLLATHVFNGLYIRQEYWDLHGIIVQELADDTSLQKILVVGSPGIGYWYNTNGYEISDIPRAQKEYEGLFDGTELNGAMGCGPFSRVFLFASPCIRNYGNFVKDACFKVYMNPWTKAECQRFADTIHLEDQEDWLRKFNLVGGKPRFLFSSQQTFNRLVKRVKGDIPYDIAGLKHQVQLFQPNVFNSEMKHIILSLYRDEQDPSDCFMAYSSLVVEAMVGAHSNSR